MMMVAGMVFVPDETKLRSELKSKVKVWEVVRATEKADSVFPLRKRKSVFSSLKRVKGTRRCPKRTLKEI